MLGAVLLACGLSTQLAFAQTAVITPYTLSYWAGVNTSNVLGVGSNLVVTTGSPTVTLAVSGPSGVTPTLTPVSSTTGSTNLGIVLACTNATAGANTLTISAAGGASYSTNVNLYVVPQWGNTNAGSTGNWSDPTRWSGGAVPGTLDSVYFEKLIPAPFTNVVDSSRTIQNLIFLGDADDGNSGTYQAYTAALDTVFSSGATLSVLGNNGFFIGRKSYTGNRPFYKFEGGGTLLVSNTAANFGVIDGDANASRYLTVNMTNLNNLKVVVNRFGVGDSSMANQGVYNGYQMVALFLAKTNLITAYSTDNYYSPNWNAAIQYERSDAGLNGTQPCSFNLGISNGIYADSVAIGHGYNVGSGSPNFSVTAYPLRFNPQMTNETAPYASAVFRNTNGGRMSLLALGVDIGTTGVGGNNRGFADFRGGNVDMLVDQIWLGANRTNSSQVKDDQGGLYFDWGKINANTIIAGDQIYTNACQPIVGWVLVGTNGTLNVNNNLILGLTPTNVTGFASQAAAVSGEVQINNGGTLLANKITVGQFSTNNVINIELGGSLVVSNTIASTNAGLTTLFMDGANLTFSVLAGITNAYVTNLNTTTTASKINIASAPSGQSTNVLIVYQAANQTPNLAIGSVPPGFNNMQIVVDTVGKTVSLIISTNQPKSLAWRGGASSQWDHASLNWLDKNTLAITKFTDGDSVTFDDTTGVPTNITIAENVNPNQSITGILVTNKVNQFTFNNAGGGGIGSCALVKTGTNSLEIDCATSVGVQLNNGILNVYSGGSIANATTVSGTTLNVDGTSSVSGGVTCAGTLSNAGTISGSLTIQASSSVSNYGNVVGPVSMDVSTTLNNTGTLEGIGTLSLNTNATLINSGTIYGSTLTVNVGGTLVDTVAGSYGASSGSINVGTLNIFGKFYPGGLGSSIATTKVTDYNYAGTPQGSPNGRVQLNAGSITVLKVNSTNAQPYTQVLSQSQVFGPSGSAKAINGCTLLISNVGPASFTAGQSFQMFGGYYVSGENVGNAGLNTTNSYPIIVPPTPGPGLIWDLSQLYPNGNIGVIAAGSIQITVTNNVTFIPGTNQVVMELSWPADFIGSGWLQQQIVTLTNGLGTNWSNLGSSDYVNDIFLTNTITPDSATFYRFVRP